MKDTKRTESAEEFIKRKEQEYKKVKPIPMKDIGRKGKHYFIREAYVFMKQSNLPEKVFVLERLRKIKTEGELSNNNANIGTIEYRVGYYMIGKIGRMNGKWLWGQFCPLIPKEDFEKLIRLAKQKRVIR
jgi:hypothetical protein